MQPSASFFQRLKLAWGVLWRGPSAHVHALDAAKSKPPAAVPKPTAGPVGKRVETPAPAQKKAPAKLPAELLAAHRRFGAAALLKKLQREGRLVDFLRQSIDGFSDAEVGVAARLLHEGCAKALEDLAPVELVVKAEEGERVSTDRPAGQLRWSGVVSDPPPKQATLVHPGWQVRAFNLPEPVGAIDASTVGIIAPAEVEP